MAYCKLVGLWSLYWLSVHQRRVYGAGGLELAYVQEYSVGHYVPLVYVMGLAWLYSINKLSRTVLV